MNLLRLQQNTDFYFIIFERIFKLEHLDTKL